MNLVFASFYNVTVPSLASKYNLVLNRRLSYLVYLNCLKTPISPPQLFPSTRVLQFAKGSMSRHLLVCLSPVV